MSASTLVARWLARADDPRPVIHDAHGVTCWSDGVRRANRTAAALIGGRKSLRGENVALLLPPGASFVASFFGVLRAGAAVVPISPQHPPPEVIHVLDDAGVRTVIASRDLADRVTDRRVLLADELATDAALATDGALPDLPDDDDPALVVYTSGTTGRPKGAVLTHANVAVQQRLLADAWGLCEHDVLLHVLPLHHIHGLGIALLPALGAGASVRFVDFATGPFDAAAVWSAMPECTVLMAVPSIHSRLLAALDASSPPLRARFLESGRALRLVTSGSAALPVSLGDRWRALSGAYPLERYGMTELGVALSNALAAERRRPGTVGLPLPTVRTRIVGDDGNEAESGELWVAGPSVFTGYHGREAATKEAFVVERGVHWFRTGDTVARDPDGLFRILGRTSVDILKSGGYKLSAPEIEEAVREHPAVADVAVVGLPDTDWGDRAVACIVAREGLESSCTESELRTFLKTRIAPYKVPRQVVVLRELPRNALGKVLKPALIAMLRNRS
jgi:malonyl-CoA/methylmalonyl-CoA synthetase